MNISPEQLIEINRVREEIERLAKLQDRHYEELKKFLNTNDKKTFLFDYVYSNTNILSNWQI